MPKRAGTSASYRTIRIIVTQEGPHRRSTWNVAIGQDRQIWPPLAVAVLAEMAVLLGCSGRMKPSRFNGATSASRMGWAVGWQLVMEEELMKSAVSGGEGGIRTRDTLASMPHFECGAFNHSATSPIPILSMFLALLSVVVALLVTIR